MNFTAIDFETSNGKNACSIGIAVVKDGEIVTKKQWLIKPYDTYFNPFAVQIHGITWRDVRNEPEFDVLWKTELHKYFNSGETIVAHNAKFDIAVLMNCLEIYNIPFPEIDFNCTLILARKIWTDMPRHKLNLVSDRFGIKFRHHDALEDAVACAKIAIIACKELAINDLNALSAHFLVDHGRLLPENGVEKLKINKPKKKKPVSASLNKMEKECIVVKSEELLNKTFVIGGIFDNYDGKELIHSIYENGGKCTASVSKKTDYLIAGKQINESKLSKAKDLGVAIITEQDYLYKITL